MTSLLDLIPTGDEVRCTAVLAMLLSLDRSGELLLALLRKAQDSWPDHSNLVGRAGASGPTDTWQLDGTIENLHLTTEEAIEQERQEGRFDLVARFDLAGKPHVVVIEVKVQAAGEHGHQLALYERQLQAWESEDRESQDSRQYALILLTLRAVEESTWNTDLSTLPHLAGFLRWTEVLEELGAYEKRHAPASDNAISVLGAALRQRLEELSMTAKDYQPLMRAEHYPYPLLVDALEAVAREVAGDATLHKDPRGTEGAPWDSKASAYWCGYWWRLGGEEGRWASLRMEWDWTKESAPQGKQWIPDGTRSGYAFEIALRIGDEKNPVLAWSEQEFVAELDSIVQTIQDLLRPPS